MITPTIFAEQPAGKCGASADTYRIWSKCLFTYQQRADHPLAHREQLDNTPASLICPSYHNRSIAGARRAGQRGPPRFMPIVTPYT